MTRLSIIDIFGVLINVSKQSYFFIVLLVALIILGLGLTFINPKNEKKYKALYIAIITIILVFLVVSYASSLGKMFNYMMDNFFIAALFPNIAIYTAAIITMNIIVWISVFNYKSARPIRNLNITIFCIMTYILALLSHVIISNKLDVYSQESIYKNTDARALIELSSLIFIVWIIFLVLYKIILVYIRKDYKPKVKKIIVHKREKILPNNFLPVDTPTKVFGRAPHQTTIVKEIKEEVKEEKKEKIEQVENTKTEDRFTIDEYKLFYEILKNEQKRNQVKKEQLTSKKYMATDNKTKEAIYGNPNNKVIKDKPVISKQEDESLAQINTIDQLINNIKQEEKNAIKEKPQEVVETINNKVEEVIEEPLVEKIDNSISKIIKLDQIDDNENKVEIERKYETEPIPEMTSLDSYRDAQKQEIIRMEEERRELLKQEQLRIEQEKQEKLLEQERQEKIRQEHLLEMQKSEEKKMENLLQEKLLEEEREQEKLTELERLYRSIR